jgi:cytoskeletal protein RodZ
VSDPFFMNALMFQFAPVFIGIIFVIVIGSILLTVFKGIGEWHQNEQSPKLSVPAIVKTKRTHVSKSSNMHHHHDQHIHNSSSTHTNYYVTFEFESGDRTNFGYTARSTACS